mgnify:CR=1 FL=1
MKQGRDRCKDQRNQCECFHNCSILLWVILFPDKPGEMTAFGFVQHNFFILFNAAMGLLFLRRATRDLFGARA